MLKNDYLLAKIGVDPAENEPSKVMSAEAGGGMKLQVRGRRMEAQVCTANAQGVLANLSTITHSNWEKEGTRYDTNFICEGN